MPDELTGIFDKLDPSAFAMPIEALPTTAIEQRINPARNWTGEHAFELFVRSCVEQLRIAFTVTGGQPVPYAVLCNDQLERTFLTIENGAENYQQFYHRLHGEVQIMSAHWMFTFFKVPVSLIADVQRGKDGVPADISAEDLENARQFARTAVTWFAESVEPGNAVKQRGFCRVVDNRLEDQSMIHVTAPTMVDHIFHPPQKLP